MDLLLFSKKSTGELEIEDVSVKVRWLKGKVGMEVSTY